MEGEPESHAPATLDVLIPVYNEAENIQRTLDALSAGIQALDPGLARFQVTVIYDNEQDTTLPVLDEIEKNYPFEIRRLRNPDRGVIGALKTGLRNSQCDFQLVTMADMSDDYSSLGPMVQKAVAGADVVCASRYMPGGQLHGGPLLKQILSRLAGVSLHWLVGFPAHDVTNSYKLYRRSAVAELELESQGGFEIGMEITLKTHLRGGRIDEVPTQWWDRTAGSSRFKLWTWLPRYLHWYFMALATNRAVKQRPAWMRNGACTLLAAFLAATFFLSFSPLAAPLTDRQGFRQSQTAISVWWMSLEGIHLAYPTPVLGMPWAIPMEFPLYQWIVTLLVRWTAMPLESVGRLLSLTCYLAALVLLYLLLATRVQDRASRLLLVCFVAASPLYLFWSHTFLIETMSLALCLGFLLCFQKGIQAGSSRWLAAAAGLGTVAALVKVTSMPAYYVLALLLWLRERWRHNPGSLYRPSVRSKGMLASLALPFLGALAWTRYSDQVKAANPLAAHFLTSSALKTWNFGTWAQRESWDVWTRIVAYTQVFESLWLERWLGVALPLVPALFAVAFFLGRKRRMETLFCLVVFLVNPIIFTNLHYIHDYYPVPNALLLSLALGFPVLGMLEDERSMIRASGILAAGFLLLSLFGNYWVSYRPLQMAPPPYPAMASEIQRRVPADGVLLIYGQDWNPMLPFAARRRAIMDRWVLPLDSERFQESIRATGKDSIQAMVVPAWAPAAFTQARCRYFGFSPAPVAQVGAEALYVRPAAP